MDFLDQYALRIVICLPREGLLVWIFLQVSSRFSGWISAVLKIPQNSSQYHYIQGPFLLIITGLCQKFWKPNEYLLGTTKTLR